ncbi:MAG: UDP-N-acetylmuramoyl-tripeptide--D-alanyl-D-alanine ligase [Lachnospiraceae bacterium]|nr:UDP-N-acetylmuramoyl-tripeptide--D-alanyl-D-alanine ligase [Lachnospiraceae bacterium]MBQ6993453.1 UDP-N-acetylmuramoyl-tripeptide--D-alanyl-D-alanine ligase [Lachnospiraceae bacterium]
MKNMTLHNIAKAVGGKLFCAEGKEHQEVKGVVLDSRKVEQDFLFVATVGERVDGHSFIEQVYEKGALCVICEKAPQNPSGAYILVESSFQALKDVAKFYRENLDIKVVGITGSVGKTSTKEFIASVLESHYKVLKTEGNFNNEVGLPLTVLRIQEDTEVAVLEMGISDFGEMHRLSEIAQPDICVITNIGQCHLENLGTRDGILKAKTEIFDFMKADGSVCLNGDDDKLITVQNAKGNAPIFFGRNETHAIYASDCENQGLAGSKVVIHREGRSFTVEIPLPGEHMIYNALAATAVATMLGLSDEEIQKGIAAVEPVGGRSHIIRNEKVTIIDDCYNANPVSMKAAVDLLTMANSRTVAILGDMFELGSNEKKLHYEVGAYTAEKGIDMILCVGDLSKNIYEGALSVNDSTSKVCHFVDKATLLEQLGGLLQVGDSVLVKASHGMHFEELLDKILCVIEKE